MTVHCISTAKQLDYAAEHLPSCLIGLVEGEEHQPLRGFSITKSSFQCGKKLNADAAESD
jgi:hypothetical protein